MYEIKFEILIRFSTFEQRDWINYFQTVNCGKSRCLASPQISLSFGFLQLVSQFHFSASYFFFPSLIPFPTLNNKKFILNKYKNKVTPVKCETVQKYACTILFSTTKNNQFHFLLRFQLSGRINQTCSLCFQVVLTDNVTFLDFLIILLTYVVYLGFLIIVSVLNRIC